MNTKATQELDTITRALLNDLEFCIIYLDTLIQSEIVSIFPVLKLVLRKHPEQVDVLLPVYVSYLTKVELHKLRSINEECKKYIQKHYNTLQYLLGED